MLIKRITKEDLFKKVDSNSIFNYYFGPFECYRKSYPSVFRTDSNPSTGFFVNPSGEVVYSDLATGEKWGAISFVMALFGLKYQEALDKIAKDFGVIKSNNTLEPSAKIIKQRIKPKVDKIIEITTSGWNTANIQFWEQYHITKEELEFHKIYPVNKLFINNFLIKNENKSPRFAFYFNEKDKEYLKIYSPLEKNFKWVSNCPLKIPFGYKDLEFKSDTLIITKSLKDLIVCRKFFPDVIALQNESKAAWDDALLNPIIERYKNIIVWFDNDDAGKAALELYSTKFKTFCLPDVFRKKYDVKDPADFIKMWGKDYLKLFLQSNDLFKRTMLENS